jgi:N-methylhydantoinase B
MRKGKHWVHMEIFEGSYGGRAGLDGMDAVDTLYANTRNNPIEDIESHLPLRVARYELREGASGAGEWRGGLGSVREFVYLSDGGASVEGEGHEFAPWGFAGGKQGSSAELRLVRQDGSVEVLPSKVPHMQIRAGERFVCVGPAGGGYGNPLARAPERVRHDVADGLLSVEAARRDYAVVLTSPGSVDEAETARLRAIRF